MADRFPVNEYVVATVGRMTFRCVVYRDDGGEYVDVFTGGQVWQAKREAVRLLVTCEACNGTGRVPDPVR